MLVLDNKRDDSVREHIGWFPLNAACQHSSPTLMSRQTDKVIVFVNTSTAGFPSLTSVRSSLYLGAAVTLADARTNVDESWLHTSERYRAQGETTNLDMNFALELPN